jgi:hypothetical protein
LTKLASTINVEPSINNHFKFEKIKTIIKASSLAIITQSDPKIERNENNGKTKQITQPKELYESN